MRKRKKRPAKKQQSVGAFGAAAADAGVNAFVTRGDPVDHE